MTARWSIPAAPERLEPQDTKPPVVGHARGSGLCPTTGSHPTALGGDR